MFNGKLLTFTIHHEHGYTDALFSGFGAHWRTHRLADVWTPDNIVCPKLRFLGNWVHTTGYELPSQLKANIN